MRKYRLHWIFAGPGIELYESWASFPGGGIAVSADSIRGTLCFLGSSRATELRNPGAKGRATAWCRERSGPD